MTLSTEPDDADAGSILENAWRDALGKAPSGADSDFFAAGGDSLLTVRMVSRMRRSGLRVSPADILRGRTFGGILARLEEDSPAAAAPPSPATADDESAVSLLPSQRRWISNDFAEPDHFALAWVFEVPERTPDGTPVDEERLRRAIDALVRRHEALRTAYLLDQHRAEVLPEPRPGLLTTTEATEDGVLDALAAGLRAHRLSEGRVLSALWLADQRLLQVAVHHLTLDGYSLGVLADDLEALLVGTSLNDAPSQPRDKAAAIQAWLSSQDAAREAEAWAGQPWDEVQPIPTERNGPALLPTMDTVVIRMEAQEAAAVADLASAVGQPVDSVVLAAAGTAITEHFGLTGVSIDVYHHGREGLPGESDLTTAIGYFQASYPVVLAGDAADGWLPRTVTRLDRLPENRTGFDALRQAGRAGLDRLPRSRIRLNFRSRMNELNTRAGAWLTPSETASGGRRSPRQAEPYPLMLEGDQVAGELVLGVKYSREHYTRETIRKLLRRTSALLADAARTHTGASA